MASPAGSAGPAGPADAPAGARAREILVVDDLPEIGEFFRALMRRVHEGGIRLTTEINSERALATVRERDFDLVISDFRMRQVDGIEVLTAARERNPQGLRVLMTGYNEIPTSIERIKQARVDAYVQKPLRAQDLLLLILDFVNGNAASIEAMRREARELETLGAVEETQRSALAR